MATVKLVKHHLIETMKESIFTYEERTTLLIQIEEVFNSRPLLPLSDDSSDVATLTFGHFLIEEPLVTLPEPPLYDIQLNRLDRCQFIQQRFQYFWKTWSRHYLQQLTITKWSEPLDRLKVGFLVLITSDNTPPTKWPLARVLEVFLGKDGLTRVVKLKTAVTELIRPITKLALLPRKPSDVVINQQHQIADGEKNIANSANYENI